MNLYSLRHAAEVFDRDKKTIAKYARRLQADGKLVFRRNTRDRKAILIDDPGMDALADVFGDQEWRQKAPKARIELLSA